MHLDLAILAARKAGAFLAQHSESSKQVTSAVGRDIHLEADQQSEALILGELQRETDYPILTEESGALGPVDSDRPLWIVDPLDGTANYSRGTPLCCVSIALAQQKELVLGVVYDFNRDELFTATRGGGAFLNGNPIHVSAVQDKSQAILATGFPLRFDLSDTSLAHFAARIRAFKKIRMLGSAALSLAYVACGRADAYMEDNIMYWDVAAGLMLVQEAGGVITMQSGGQPAHAVGVTAAAHTHLCL